MTPNPATVPKELLATERFTTPDAIAGAVSFGLTYAGEKGKPRLTTHDARKIMAHLQIPEPGDKRSLLTHFLRPASLKDEKRAERWPINTGAGAASDVAWAHIAGIENGWFSPDRIGFLNWTPKGRDKFSAVVGAKPPEPREDADASPTIETPAKPAAKTHTQRVERARQDDRQGRLL